MWHTHVQSWQCFYPTCLVETVNLSARILPLYLYKRTSMAVCGSLLELAMACYWYSRLFLSLCVCVCGGDTQDMHTCLWSGHSIVAYSITCECSSGWITSVSLSILCVSVNGRLSIWHLLLLPTCVLFISELLKFAHPRSVNGWCSKAPQST